jgi:transcriptional regulator with GAF, ATPase, and Fis domain
MSATPDDRTAAERTTRSFRASDLAGEGGPAPDLAPTPLPPYAARGGGGPAAHAPLVGAERFLRVLELARTLGESPDPERLLDTATDAALETLEAERAFLVLAEPGKRRFEVARNFDKEEVLDPESKVSTTVLEKVLATGKPVLLDDATGAPAADASKSLARLKLRSVLCAPIRVLGRVEGALYVDNRFRKAAFGDIERRLLEAIADHCGLALERSRLLLDARAARTRAEEEAAGLRGELQSQRIELGRLTSALSREGEESGLRHEYPTIIGRSAAIRRVLSLIDKITGSDIPVLVTGESGTGKELVARALHVNSPRKLGPFVAENFAAIPESLGESELFGHVRGAFTGAEKDRAGLFERAHKGTLFLDEVGDMSPNLQKKLLRALQEGEVRRLGSEKTIPIDARVVAATHQDLLARVKSGEFREDLYYRLNVVEVRLPSLKERVEDIPALVEHFLATSAKEEGKPRKGISREALRHLARRPWPGNVRELENAIRRLAALADDTISQRDVIALEAQAAPAAGAPSGNAPGTAAGGAWRTLEELEREQIERVLAACAWRPTEAAKVLGISYTTLWRKMKSYGLRAGGARG